MPRKPTGRARPHKIQTCLSDAELEVLAGALRRAHGAACQQQISEPWRISASRLLKDLALSAARDEAVISASAAAHAADKSDPRGKPAA